MSLDIKNLTVNQRNLLSCLFLLNKENAYLDATTVQKFMFLISKNFPDEFRDYNEDYEAYDFGPYSEEVEHDAIRLQGLRILDNKLAVIAEGASLVSQIRNSKPELVSSLSEYVNGLGRIGRDDLIYIVYSLYPEYTKRSRISEIVRSVNYELSVIDFEQLKKRKEIIVTTDKHNTLKVRLVGDKIEFLSDDERRER